MSDGTWTGALNTVCDAAGNWLAGAMPEDHGDVVTVAAVTNLPVTNAFGLSLSFLVEAGLNVPDLFAWMTGDNDIGAITINHPDAVVGCTAIIGYNGGALNVLAGKLTLNHIAGTDGLTAGQFYVAAEGMLEITDEGPFTPTGFLIQGVLKVAIAGEGGAGEMGSLLTLGYPDLDHDHCSGVLDFGPDSNIHGPTKVQGRLRLLADWYLQGIEGDYAGCALFAVGDVLVDAAGCGTLLTHTNANFFSDGPLGELTVDHFPAWGAEVDRPLQCYCDVKDGGSNTAGVFVFHPTAPGTCLTGTGVG